MNTCDTCKHWKLDEEWRQILKGYGACTNLKVIGAEDHLPDSAYIEDGDYAASRGSFETGPKFGCIHHESK